MMWFKTQDDAIKHMVKQGHELLVKDGKFRFGTFADQEAFIDCIEETEESERNYYEILLSGKPQRLFADLEGYGLSIERKEMYSQFIELMRKCLKCVGFKFKNKLSHFLNSSGDKISGHWSYEITFGDSEQQKRFWVYVTSVIESDYPDLCYISESDGILQRKTIVDLSVYSKNRAMRTIYSQKKDSGRILMPFRLKDGEISYLKRFNAIDYLIYGHDDDVDDIKVPEFEKVALQRIKRSQIEEIIANAVPNTIIGDFNGRFFKLKNDGVRHCIIGGEENKSDNSYVVWKQDGLYFGCHDEECSGKMQKIHSIKATPKQTVTNWAMLANKAKMVKTADELYEFIQLTIDFMNTRFTYIVQDGKTVIARESEDCKPNEITLREEKETIFLTKNSFFDCVVNRRIKIKLKADIEEEEGYKAKKGVVTINPGVLWFNSPKRSMKKNQIFEPFKEGCTLPKHMTTRYNLWKGYSVLKDDCQDAKMLKNKCDSAILLHIYKRWCLNDAKLFKWVIGWFASLLQNPDKKPKSAIVLMSKEGSGKGLIISMIRRIMGRRYVYQPSKIAEVLGGFNPGLSACKLLFLDEMFWGGDKNGAAELKKLITEDEITINVKNLSSYVCTNHFGVVMASNETWSIPAGSNARRYCVLNLDNELSGLHGDKTIINTLVHESKDPACVKAFAKYLYSFDLSDFNSNLPPVTQGLRDQKLLSLSKVATMACQMLDEGCISDIGAEMGEFIRKKSLFEYYKLNQNDSHMKYKAFFKQLGECFGNESMFTNSCSKRIDGVCIRGFMLPTLKNARNGFRSYIHDPEWQFEDVEKNNDSDNDESSSDSESDDEINEMPPKVLKNDLNDLFHESDAE